MPTDYGRTERDAMGYAQEQGVESHLSQDLLPRAGATVAPWPGNARLAHCRAA